MLRAHAHQTSQLEMITQRGELVPQKLKRLRPERHLAGQLSPPKPASVSFGVFAETSLKVVPDSRLSL